MGIFNDLTKRNYQEVTVSDNSPEQDNIDAAGKLAAIDKAQAVIEFNMDGTVITANTNFLSTLGYSLGEIEGQHHSMFVEPSYKASAEYQQFWAKLNRGEYDAGEYKRIAKGGKEVWIQASYNPIQDADGKVTKVVKFATDITEEKLRNADAVGKLSAIDKAQAIIEFNLDGTIISANTNFLNTVGYTASEIEGQHHSLFVDAEYKASSEYREFWAKLNRGEYDASEYKRLGKGGKEIWIQASYNPIQDADGKVYKVVKFATDITEQKNREVEATRAKAALDAVTSPVVVADADNVIVYANAEVLSMLRNAEPDIRAALPNFSVDTMVGSSIDIFHKNPAHQRNMLSGLTGRYQSEIKVGVRTFSLALNPVFDEAGARQGTTVEWLDRTEQLAFETVVDDAISAAVSGELCNRIDLTGREGFVAKVATGINKLMDIFENVLKDAAASVGEMAEGRLTRKIETEYEGSFNELKNDINQTIDKLVEIVSEISISGSSVKEAASEIASGNLNLSQRTEEQAASLEETSAAMEEVTTTVQQNAENAVQANGLARGARETAENGGAVVSKAVSAMEAISESSNKINDIIGVIDEIAFQTNLLALNAAVEAARAGDQGRGFAVVADEVRSLAGRSATAAKEIKELIKDSGEKVQEGSDLVNKSGSTLEEIVTAVKKVNDIVAEISTASEEQATGLDEINKAVGEMDEMTQQNAALVEEAAAASEAMGNQAENLDNLISFFDTGVDRSRPSARSSSAVKKSAASQTNANNTPRAKAKPAASASSSDKDWSEF